MDFNDYWQENKRFVGLVAGGALCFVIAYAWIGGRYGDAIKARRADLARMESELKKAHFSALDRERAEADNEALSAAVRALEARVDFAPRSAFRIDASPGAPSAGSQYLRALSDVRDALVPRANRANVKVDPGLGMPALSPTRDDEIGRYMEALDVVDAVCTLAIDCGVRRIERIAVRMDPRRMSRDGVGRVEQTEVVFSIEGEARSLTELCARTQRPGDRRPLCVREVELLAVRGKPGEARLDLSVVAPRLSARFGAGEVQ